MKRVRVVGSGAIVLLGACNAIYGLEQTVLFDVRPDGYVCARSGAFGGAREVPIDGAYSVEAARFNQPRSIAYLSLCPANGDKTMCDLYTSPFTPATGTFTAFAKLTGVSAVGFYDSYPTITPDGGFLLFGSTRAGDVHIFAARANNASFDMPTITQPTLAAGTAYSNEPFVLGDGRTLYFSAAGTSFRWDLYRATGGPPAFGGSAPVEGTNLAMTNDMAPVVSDDELEIFFASNRANPSVDDAHDIYRAERTSPSAPFDTPARVASASSAGIDWPVWISPDNCELYYINKVNGVATLYVTRR